MLRKQFKQKGFTLLEIILAIAAMAAIAVVAGVGLVEMTKGYIFSKKNAFIAQQGQIALARLKKEISNVRSVTGVPTATSITFVRNSDLLTQHTISWAGGSNPLQVDGDTLVTPVTSFNLNFYQKFDDISPSPYSSTTTSMIEIAIQLKGAENATINFTDRVNLYLETGGS
jgi:prepilin-type N-terminal cleavage/methylation domain-containing protein